MARQRGIVKLDGTISDITFHKTKDGYMAKEKTLVPAGKIASSPSYARTRENMAEFGRAGKAGKVLRSAFRASLQKVADSRMVSRLTREMMRIVHTDVTNGRGMRTVVDGDLALLEAFDFNVNGRLDTTLSAPYTATIDRASGEAAVNLPAFVPVNVVAAPIGATHFRLFMAAAIVDFSSGSSSMQATETEPLPWVQTATAPIDLRVNLAANSTHPLLLALGVEFLQEVNGMHYPLKNGSFNAMALVKVEVV